MNVLARLHPLVDALIVAGMVVVIVGLLLPAMGVELTEWWRP